ncbi:MAG: hypothetical protein ACLT3H_05195 [Roseburia sp.]
MPERIDLVISGYDAEHMITAVLLELKQWSKVERCDQLVSYKVHVQTNNETEIRDHPSYQIKYYRNVLREGLVEEGDVKLYPAAVLHNYVLKEKEDPLLAERTVEFLENEHIEMFFFGNEEKLSAYLQDKIRFGDEGKTIDYLDERCYGASSGLCENVKHMVEHGETPRRVIGETEGTERFRSSIQYLAYFKRCGENDVSIIAVDEAHQINSKDHLDWIIQTATASVFFLDEK